MADFITELDIEIDYYFPKNQINASKKKSENEKETERWIRKRES